MSAMYTHIDSRSNVDPTTTRHAHSTAYLMSRLLVPGLRLSRKNLAPASMSSDEDRRCVIIKNY